MGTQLFLSVNRCLFRVNTGDGLGNTREHGGEGAVLTGGASHPEASGREVGVLPVCVHLSRDYP